MRRFDLLALTVAALVCLGPPIVLFASPAPAPLVPPAEASAPVLSSALWWRSVGVACVAALVAMTAGGALGWALTRSPRRLRPALLAAAPLSLLMPPYLAAMAWARLLSPASPVVGAPGSVLPESLPAWGVAGAVLGGWTAPLVALPLAAALPALDGAAAESARLLLGPWRRLRWWCAALRAPILGGGALAFCLAATNLAAPLVLRADVYPLEVFTRFSVYDLRGAASATLPLIALGVAALTLRAALVGRAPTAMVGPRWRPDTAPGRPAAAALAVGLLGVLVVLPLVALARDVEDLGQLRRALATAGDELFVTLRVAALSAVVLALLGFAVAGALRRRGPRTAAVLGLLLLVPLALPGAAVGLGLQRLAALGVLPHAVADGPVMLVLAATARYLPLATLPALAALDRVDPRLDEAARLSGMSAPTRWLRVRLPLAAPDVAAVLVVGFAFAAGELAAAVLVEPPGTTTLAVRLATLLHFGEDGLVAALCLLLAGVVGVSLAVAGLLVGRALVPRLDDLR